MTKTKILTVRLEPTLYQQLQARAAEEEVTLSTLVREVLKDMLAYQALHWSLSPQQSVCAKCNVRLP